MRASAPLGEGFAAARAILTMEMDGMANQPIAEITKVVRVMPGVLGVVAVAIITPIIFSALVFLFAPFPFVAKCVFGGLGLGFALMVWLQFWAKAKNELFASKRVESLPRVLIKEISQTPKPGDKNGSQP